MIEVEELSNNGTAAFAQSSSRISSSSFLIFNFTFLIVMKGLFVGMVTLDLVYLAAKLPESNQKVVASDYTVAAGGPVTNAAVTFGHLGNQATLLGAVGTHPITHLIREDVASYGVAIADLAPTMTQPPPVSSIIVTQATGDRAVISLNATPVQVSRNQLPLELDWDDVDVVLMDGHQLSAALAIAPLAKANNIPIIIDGGSWKPGFEEILPFVDCAICSANFYPQVAITARRSLLNSLPQGFLTLPSPKAKNPFTTLAVASSVNCQCRRLKSSIPWGRVMFFTEPSAITFCSKILSLP